ncbi:hypothetical protein FACS1894140_5400 [Spirochaetia bacterium]|nr:hypothetical protein FACS1894140_5400 [Spirochaetia bacterium]
MGIIFKGKLTPGNLVSFTGRRQGKGYGQKSRRRELRESYHKTNYTPLSPPGAMVYTGLDIEKADVRGGEEL